MTPAFSCPYVEKKGAVEVLLLNTGFFFVFCYNFLENGKQYLARWCENLENAYYFRYQKTKHLQAPLLHSLLI